MKQSGSAAVESQAWSRRGHTRRAGLALLSVGKAGREQETAFQVGGRGAGRGGLRGEGTGEAAWHALPSMAKWEEDSEELLQTKNRQNNNTSQRGDFTQGKSESPHRRPSGRPGETGRQLCRGRTRRAETRGKEPPRENV